MVASLIRALLGPRISIVHAFKKPPYGGGNQFLLALKGEFRRRGLDVGASRIGSRTKHVLFNSFNFDMDWLRYRLSDRERYGIKTVHRVDGPISAYRGRDIDLDRQIFEVNRDLADVTVFQSQFSLTKHLEIGLDFGSNVAVIPNAVNPAIFNPEGRIAIPLDGQRKVRLIATSWSPNRRKGADIFEWLDDHLDFSIFDFTFVGNTESTFRNIRVLPPVPSEALARILRQQDIYVTASINDPCSNALTEALSCGLPALYRISGGHPEIVKKAGLGFTRGDEIPALLERLLNAYEDYRLRIDVPTITDVAACYAALLGVTMAYNSHA